MTGFDRILTQAELVREDAPRSVIGGKAAGLVALARLGLPVPRFFVLPGPLLDGHDQLPAALEAPLRQALAELGDVPVAVRSSAAAEDSATASFAGQFRTILGARSFEGVRGAIALCLEGARDERVKVYAALHGVNPGSLAIVVQEMVEGDASGVLFTRDPAGPDRALVSVGLGLGEGVVQGQVPCDTFKVDEQDRIESELVEKDAAYRFVDGAPAEVPVAPAVLGPALSDGALRAVVRHGRTLERALGRPQDVEFTVRGDDVVLLQTRPITTPIPWGRRLLWDNSNIVESYSGITTPLTFSFASKVYTIVYQLFCRVMGVREDVIRENEPVFRRMIGLVKGRIYYNLNAWYRLIQLLPGYQFNRGAMETMMGVAEVASDDDAGANQSRWVAGLEIGRLVSRLGWRLFRIEADAAAFQRKFDDALERAKAEKPDQLRADELLDSYERLERELLWAWTPPLVNDFFCMIFYKLLQKQAQELTGDPATQLHNRLLAGHGTLASAAPAEQLLELAKYAAAIPDLLASLRSDAPDVEVIRRLRQDAGFEERFRRWLDRYGDRSPDELKLESATLEDTPEFILGTLRAYARDPASVRSFGADEKATREAAEREVAPLLRGFVARRKFAFILGQTRRRVAMRESLRFERTRVFGHVRRLFRAFGDRFVEGGFLRNRDDVFYLTVDEILGFVRGTTASVALQATSDLRRAEFAAYRAAEPPDERFWTWGAVHVANQYRRPTAAEPPPTGDEMKGTPCSPGVIVATARVVRDPREIPDLKGAILVAHRTDPGWIPLYPTAGAILVERGSLLSHSAVVARELGIPGIVGARGLLSWVQDGETIGMDGTTGRIWKVHGPR